MTTTSTANKKNKQQQEQEKPKLTKRQKIKNLQKSDLNRWPQQPNIKSPSARAKAYLRAANLHKKDDYDDDKTNNNKNKNMIDPALDLNAPEVKFGRLVGSTDASKRHGAIRKLELYLKERSKVENEGLCELDLMKLWKGLWHCLYMADKVPVQDELSRRLSELIWCVSGTKEEDQYAAQFYLEMDAVKEDSEDEEEEEEEEDLEPDNDEMKDNEDNTMKEVKRKRKKGSVDDDDNDDVGSDGESSSSTKSSDVNDDDDNEDDDDDEDESLVKHCRGAHLVALMLRTFFKTVCREWGKMDKYRVDKFYTLIRLMMHQIYKYMAVRGWHLGLIRLLNDVVYEEVLAGEELPNNGVRFHIIDLSLEEIVAVEREVGGVTTRIFLDVMEPFWNLCQAEDDQVVRDRVMEAVVERFLERFSVVNTENTDESLKFEKVKVGDVAEFLFGLASDEDTIDKYRESLYGSHKMYLKRLKEVGYDAVDESMEEESSKCEPCSTTIEEDNTIEIAVENENMEEETTQPGLENKISNANTVMTDNTSSEKKKHKKKKKKKRSTEHETTSDADDNNTHGEPDKEEERVQKDPAITDNVTKQKETECDANTTEPSSSTKKNKHKKKKKKHDNKTPSKTNDNHDVTQAPVDNNDNKDTTIDDNETKPLTSNKKKKKQHKDDVITITSKEQTRAATFMHQMETTSTATTTTPPKTTKNDYSTTTTSITTTPPLTSKKDVVTGSSRSSRRVSFGRANQAKSHVKSMRDLKTMEHPSTKKRTPDKSILLKRERARGDDNDTGGGRDDDDIGTEKKRKKMTTTTEESIKKNKKSKKKKSKK